MRADRKTKGGVVIETILILAGLALIVRALMIGSVTYKFMQTAEHTEGVILTTGNFGLSHDIQLVSESAAGGATFVQEGLILHRDIGDRVPVVYDPRNPAIAEVDGFSTLWFRPLAFIVLGLGMLAFGFRLRFHRSV